MFLGRQHPGHWPRQLHCFSWGWVSGQPEVMQNLETKTSEQNNDGNECTVVWGWFPWPLFSSFPVFAFIPLLLNLLFFPYCSLSSCLSTHLSVLSVCCLCLLFSCLCPCSDALTCPNTGKTLSGHISCRKPRHVSRQAQSVSPHSQKNWVHPPQHALLFMVPLQSWCLTKPRWILIHSGSLRGTFQVLAWSHGLSEPHPFSVAISQKGSLF